jgi:hypothetical protein
MTTMAMPYDQATEHYLAQALENSASVCVDSPNKARSQVKRGIWHLRNFDGELIARVGKDFVRFVPS